ncbi:MAG: MotA/TolQ/ExbB proton channel family protein [Dokdonella sp.]|nr:MAG: MotA/TolQ/ExbB proton channel family protein [Dokdonella sp.]
MNPFDTVAHLWTTGDGVAHTVLAILFLMSVVSWYLILAKTWEGWRLRRAALVVGGFWRALAYPEGLDRLGSGPFRVMAEYATCCAEQCEKAPDLAARLDPSERIERALRQQYVRTQSNLESGLTWLATTGATAPFVGLFGTVWGVYHALAAIGFSGQASLERVAGPVGEALLMTAAGLAVALPAVFAYNAFARANRVLLADLDAFAHDLHAFLTVGCPLTAPADVTYPQRTPLAIEVG